MARFRPAGGLFTSSAFRLAAAAVASFAVLAGVLAWTVFQATNAVLTDQVVTTLAAEADALKTEGRGGLPALIDAVAARSRPEGPGLYILLDRDGRKLAGNLSRLPPEIAGADTRARTGGTFRYRPKPASLDTAGEPRARPERLGVASVIDLPGGAVLAVGRDVDDQRRFGDGVKRVVLWSFLALAALGLATAYLISRLVLKRIEAINLAAAEIMAGDLSRRVPVAGSGDELDGLAVNLNAMLDRIEQLMAGLREVSDNIAHDLKTPLNRMRNRVEAALRDGVPSLHREALERTIEEADELIRTFNALLLIARLEASGSGETASAIDLGRLIASVADLYAPVAEEAGLRLEVEAGDGPVVMANRQLLGQAIANLIDNAIKYAPPEPAAASDLPAVFSPIRITLTWLDGDIAVTVADRGPGIAAADRERALRRFVRLDASRSRPGTGLGLSLVAAVARMHGGRVMLDDNAPGLKVTLVLPGSVVTSTPNGKSTAVTANSPALAHQLAPKQAHAP